MEFIHIILFLICGIVALEMVKHLFFKKTSKMIMIFFIVFISFLVFSYSFKNIEKFEDNKLIQTGAVISGEIVSVFKEKVDIKELVNSTVKSNKLFKSSKSL